MLSGPCNTQQGPHDTERLVSGNISGQLVLRQEFSRPRTKARAAELQPREQSTSDSSAFLPAARSTLGDVSCPRETKMTCFPARLCAFPPPLL